MASASGYTRARRFQNEVAQTATAFRALFNYDKSSRFECAGKARQQQLPFPATDPFFSLPPLPCFISLAIVCWHARANAGMQQLHLWLGKKSISSDIYEVRRVRLARFVWHCPALYPIN